MFKVEKGIAPPSKGASLEFPFGDMEDGDSFFVPSKTKNPGIGRAAHTWGRRHGVKFLCKEELDKGGKLTGYRIWRIGEARGRAFTPNEENEIRT